MYNNNNFYYQQQGTNYGQPLPVAKMTEVLSEQQINELRSKGSAFNLTVDPIEATRSICTHKHKGKFTLIDNQDGTVTCSICQKTFTLTDMDQDQVVQSTSLFIDILQTIKTYYVDIPEDYVVQIFKIIPILEKVPKLYQIALNNFKTYYRDNSVNQSNDNYFAMLNVLQGGFGGGFGQPQQFMGYPQQQPQMFAQQPMMPQPQQFMGYPQQQPQMFAQQPMMPQPQGMTAPSNYPGVGIPQGGTNPFTGTPTPPYYQPQAQQPQGTTQPPAPQQSGEQINTTKAYQP